MNNINNKLIVETKKYLKQIDLAFKECKNDLDFIKNRSELRYCTNGISILNNKENTINEIIDKLKHEKLQIIYNLGFINGFRDHYLCFSKANIVPFF